ncbi:hypothetical protein [Simplicispira suum]|uniref:Lipoprotein n=1 Tax=Simplicispira suum TaxID=2109915 RepID=A0A2S0MX85_9BURK|nr:hypothetical protein [Simplicispira suum]AVO40321.1 hypothetical protein C6571_02635 [Simplicispira suum]MBW7833368.1 hypothetical protein [Simplicispira suum]
MSRLLLGVGATLCLVALGACGERPQANRGTLDTAAYEGAKNAFVDAGWKPGEKNSWEQHLRTRIQRGQNDYSRIP